MTIALHRSIAATAAAAIATATALAGTPGTPCASDLDGSGAVDGADLGILVGAWGACSGCGADLNGDGAVDAADLGELLAAWGDVPLFDYGPAFPDAEAWQVALESLGASGPLVAPGELYERIERDVALIRAAEPALQDEAHAPAWVPDHLIVKVLDGMPTDGYDCLNAHYALESAQFLFSSGGGSWYVLTFPSPVNAPALAVAYAALAEVQFAEPDGIIGGQNSWTPAPGPDGLWTWTIDDGFIDCFDGCDCHNFYTFTVDAKGSVKLVSLVQSGPPYCGF